MKNIKQLLLKLKVLLDNYVIKYIKIFLKKVLPDGIMSDSNSVLVLKRLVVFAICLFVLQGFIVSIVVFIVVKAGGESFTLPNIEGKDLYEAFNILEKEDMNLSIQTHYFAHYPLGTVVSQEPKGGTKVKRGRTVYLVLNLKESATIRMPDVTGLQYEEALNILNNEVLSKKPNISISPKVEVNDPSYENNVVLSQIPPANETVGINTEIILTVNVKN